MNKEPTYLGKIIRVDSSSIEVEIKDSISITPIIKGKIYKIGQIGTFVKIPIGNIELFGIVESVSNTPTLLVSDELNERILYPDKGKKYLRVQLVGEKIGNQKFEKGIGIFPTVNDEVHLVTEKDLEIIYGVSGENNFEIGKHSSSDNLAIYIDTHKLILRHSAVVGSTGSGKSNTNVQIIKSLLNNYKGGRIVLIDPHGEYATAFPNDAKIFKINDTISPLYIPFWIMNFTELAFFLLGADSKEEQRTEYREFREMVYQGKKGNVSKLKDTTIDINYITSDSPIPFNLKKIWGDMNYRVNATYSAADQKEQNDITVQKIKDGDYKNLIPTQFKPYVPSSKEPYKSKDQLFFAYEKKIFARLKDSRYDFMFNPGNYTDVEDSNFTDIDKLIRDWIDHEKRLTILDLSGVPFDLLDISVGLVTRFIFDGMFWGRNLDYTGKNRPLLMIYEEAHTYLPKSENSYGISGYARESVEKIFKEGRKFGVGAMVISQRPSEISETILAQVGTFVALRLTNSGDQSIIKSSAPDNMNTLINLLPSLRIGEAVIVGEAIVIPSRVRIDLAEPRPDSNDPKLVDSWLREYPNDESNYKDVIKAWREQKHLKVNNLIEKIKKTKK